MAREKTLETAPEALAGKKASEPATVRWVARNIDNPRASAYDCPDPFAWTLLRHCRANPAFTQFFIEKLWSKLIPSRAQLDEGAAKAIDGKPTLELIERILEMRDEAVEAASPNDYVPDEEPEEVPDEFSDFDPEEDYSGHE